MNVKFKYQNNEMYPFCVKYVQKRDSKDKVKMKLVSCNYYHTSERVISKFYKPISLLSL